MLPYIVTGTYPQPTGPGPARPGPSRNGILMPFVNISLARGKSTEYLEAVSRAVHDALVAELHMKPEDKFQLVHQHEPGELVFNRNFRGGPRSDDWIVFTITDGLDRGERAKRRFYKTLVRLLAAVQAVGDRKHDPDVGPWA